MNSLLCTSCLAVFEIALNLASTTDSLAGKKIYYPYVEQGELELELETDYTFDNERESGQTHAQELGVTYAPNDWWSVEMGAKLEKETGSKQEATEIFFENLFQFTEQGEYWLDAGAYVEYAVTKDGPDKAEVKLVLLKEIEQFQIATNVVAEREIGDHAETHMEWELATQLLYRHNKYFNPGIEIYNEFSDFSQSFNSQEHYVGPVVVGKWYGLKYDVGYLFGVSDYAESGAIKANIEFEF